MGRTTTTASVVMSMLALLALRSATADEPAPEMRDVFRSGGFHVASDMEPAAVGQRVGIPADPAYGGADAPLTISQLEQFALANNPTLCLAARRVQALRGKQQQVGLYPNPVVGYIGEEVGNEGRAGQHGIRVGQQIVTANKLAWNRSIVGSEIGAAEQDWAMQRLRVVNDVHAAAYDVIAAQRTVELSEELLRLAEAGLKAAEQLFAAQEVSRVDVLQARIEVNATRLELQKARYALTEQWHRLAALAGVPDMTPQRVTNDSADEQEPALDWETSRERLLSESPERMRAMSEVERARAEVGRACAGRVPDIELEAGVRYHFGTDSTLATMGVGMPLQLYDRNQGNIYKAQAELAAAHQEVRRIDLVLQERLAQEFRRYDDARRTAAEYRDALLPDAGDALKLAQAGYRQGEFDYLELLTVQQTYFRTHLAYVDAVRNARISRVRIEGLLLTGGLESPGKGE